MTKILYTTLIRPYTSLKHRSDSHIRTQYFSLNFFKLSYPLKFSRTLPFFDKPNFSTYTRLFVKIEK